LTGGAGTVVEGGAAVASVHPLDAVCLLVAAIVVLDTLGAVARGGAQTLTWMAMVAALFFVPAGLVVAELGAAFPNQGGPSVWARLAFGRRAGSLVALAYFLEPPVWVGGSLAITCVAVIDRLVLPLEGVWRVPADLAPAGAQPPRRLLRPHERVPATAAAGRVAAEIISPYPPGIPAIAPGELITTDLLEPSGTRPAAGSRMAGASDPTLETVLVVRS
jgi:glutamate:GABA antiporter